MNDYQSLAVPTLILLAIVGGALVGWALHRTFYMEDWRDAYHAGQASFRDPSDSAGA